MCYMTKKGKTQWRGENLFIVALLTDNPIACRYYARVSIWCRSTMLWFRGGNIPFRLASYRLLGLFLYLNHVLAWLFWPFLRFCLALLL